MNNSLLNTLHVTQNPLIFSEVPYLMCALGDFVPWLSGGGGVVRSRSHEHHLDSQAVSATLLNYFMASKIEGRCLGSRVLEGGKHFVLC